MSPIGTQSKPSLSICLGPNEKIIMAGGSFGFFVLVLLFWGATGGAVFFGAKTYGAKLVDKPKLLPPLPAGETLKAKTD